MKPADLRPEDFVGAKSHPLTWSRREEIRKDVILQVLSALRFLLQRQEGDKPFLDTKFQVGSGKDFDRDDPLRGGHVIYTWIQGRGLEALADHARWLEKEEAIGEELRESLISAIRVVLPRVIGSMEAARAGQGGKLPFMMRSAGDPLMVDRAGEVVAGGSSADSNWSLSDLFYAKGLGAAANYLGDFRLFALAEQNFAGIIEAIRSGKFSSGQIGLDPKNPVQEVSGRFSHAGRMIGLSAATQFYRCSGQSHYFDLGLEFIEFILRYHVQRGAGRFADGDFWEYVDSSGQPWEDGARVWSDPGHATEFAGLAFAHLDARPDLGELFYGDLRRVLKRNFSNGFTGLGLMKAFDLSARMPINSDLPWWALPETMRAAALALPTAPADEKQELVEIFLRSWEAFAGRFVRKEYHLLPVPCLDQWGNESKAIPAVPDGDPGYHTGLSLLACLPALN